MKLSSETKQEHRIIDETRRSIIDALLAMGSLTGDKEYHEFAKLVCPSLSEGTMDILVVGETVYFLTLAGENLFNMARSYKAVCQQKIEEVEQANIIGGIDCFKSTAESGHNPRRFIAFNASRLTALKKKNIRVAMAKRFSIPLDDAGDKFDATVEGAAEKIVKLLCNKGMIDPFEKTAVEVDGARQWK